jgi:hypothetical protein
MKDLDLDERGGIEPVGTGLLAMTPSRTLSPASRLLQRSQASIFLSGRSDSRQDYVTDVGLFPAANLNICAMTADT